ncbi:MAG: tRNA (adenosine(37)-N6)-threonylcarbamoyltransferase complex transferase subunit TsaD, partial [Candidatus Daviesbacteria bacterium]|nr:tRNA (adenosine(37)-N6)-threonylcarbamoyltransferase complex transferase subunit TsaD [Candidatus Daviesbacteria bacterium]
AIVQKDGNRVTILSNVVASSADLQAKFGGVIPEQAAREQLKSIIPVIQEALNQAFPNGRLPRHSAPRNDGDGIDAIAVTQGPGLIGSLLIGVETAKVLATIWKKPLIPVNHLLGHFYANWISSPVIASGAKQSSKSNNQIATSGRNIDPLRNDKFISPSFPCIGLLVSGGHTDLVLFTDHGKYKYLGGTRDDASGECFDKCARLLGLPYPGGPNLSKMAEKGNPKTYDLPRPMLNSKDLDFSFSGLKTAVFNLVNSQWLMVNGSDQGKELNHRPSTINHKQLINLAASIEDAITDVLVEKTVTAIQTLKVDQVIVAGGVAANKILAQKLTHRMSEIIPHARIFVPPPSLATDNAASIAATAFFNYHPINPLKLQANPNLSLS